MEAETAPGGHDLVDPDQKHPEVCVGAVATRTNELLMIRRATDPGRGRWSIPGGRVRCGETLAEAVVRELEEETCSSESAGPLMVGPRSCTTSYHFVILDFEVTVLDDADPRAGSDASEASWVPVWTVPELDLVDGLAEFLADHDIIETIV